MKLFDKNFWLGRPAFSIKKTPHRSTMTIVIPAWNEEDFIKQTIESCIHQTKYCSIIVVDDCSTDKTKHIAELYTPRIKVITTDKNQGSKSKALNYAIDLVETDLFVCVDADTILYPDAMEQLSFAFNDPAVMVAHGSVLSKNYSNIWESGRYGEYLMSKSIVKPAQQNVTAVSVASGCMFAIQTWFLKKYKFSERTMAEDMDLSWVAVEKGYDIAFVANANCKVADPYSYGTYTKQVSRWYRGFFQGLKVRNFNLKEMGYKYFFMIYFYMILNFVSMPMLIYAIIYSILFANPAIITGTAISLGLILAFMMYEGVKLKDNVFLYPVHLINSVLLSPIVYYVYIKSFIQEIILKQELRTWTKGH